MSLLKEGDLLFIVSNGKLLQSLNILDYVITRVSCRCHSIIIIFRQTDAGSVAGASTCDMPAGDDDSTPAQLVTSYSASDSPKVSDKKFQVNMSYHKIGRFGKLSKADFDKLGEADKKEYKPDMVISFAGVNLVSVAKSAHQKTQEEGENPSKKRKLGAHLSTGTAQS